MAKNSVSDSFGSVFGGCMGGLMFLLCAPFVIGLFFLVIAGLFG